jgi:CubicO group peptidase (beta-lactamase class C family)
VGLLCAALAATPASAATKPPSKDADAIAAIVRDSMQKYAVRAAIVRVVKDGKVVTTQAFGTSMTGVPATTDMYFRNGAVAFAYMGTLLMQYVEQGKVQLDDTIDRWMPQLPESDKVTLKMLANQTTGYPDFETDPGWNAAFNRDPFHLFTFQERLDYAFSRPLEFAPGTNWSYAHTNFMILGHILAKIGHKPLHVLLRDQVFKPMGLKHTFAYNTAKIPEPVLHSFSSERRAALGIAPGTFFYEESTFWNPVWGTPMGGSEVTTIADVTKTAIAVGTGKLLSKSSFRAMTGPNLLGFGQKQANCAPSCFTQIPAYNYGLGVVRSGNWILQDPLFGGYAAAEAYLPSHKIAIAVATTFTPDEFDDQGDYLHNSADFVWRLIAAHMVPSEAPQLPG